MIECIHRPVFDHRSDAVFAEFTRESFLVLAASSSEAPQVAGVTPGDLRANLLIVFLGGRRVDVDDVQSLDIHESRDFQRSNEVNAISAVATRLITVKINRSIAVWPVRCSAY